MRTAGSFAVAALIGISALGRAFAQEQTREPDESLPTFVPSTDIVGTTPVEGTGVERTKVPANVQTLDRSDIEKHSPLSLGDVLNSGIGGAGE